MELTYNYGVDSYDIGTGFGHFGLAVTSVVDTCDIDQGCRLRGEHHQAAWTRQGGKDADRLRQGSCWVQLGVD
jgi:hypothetical protein